jgi:hypothetical protein
MATMNPEPAAFTNDDFAARMRRVASSAVEKGLGGVIVTPGPDLVWLTGYRPTAITERLTMLVLSPDNEPTPLVPILERPDAEAAEAPAACHWWTGPMAPAPTKPPAHCCAQTARSASPIRLGRCTFWVCNKRCRSRATGPRLHRKAHARHEWSHS